MELSSLDLKPIELKFLLRLLEHAPDYRVSISKIQPNSKTPASERNRICINLSGKGLVEYTDEIPKYKTEAAGKALLESDTNTLPISENELGLVKKLLDVAVGKSATPGQARQVPASERQRLLKQLAEGGLISIIGEKAIKEVWLTQAGRQYLKHDCLPTSSSASLTLKMLGNYLKFLRQSIAKQDVSEEFANTNEIYQERTSSEIANVNSPSLDSVLETIKKLDQQLNTENYLPIFHVREKLQSTLSREEVDKLLFELQSRDLIEFSTLQDVSEYSEAQVAAGIPQNIGGALFYISVTELF